MSYCTLCRRHYREPPDEQGDHPCPKCGMLPSERGTGCEDNESYTLAESLVIEQIEDQVDLDVTMVTVGDMRDCDCVPVTVHDSAGIRWDLVSVAEAGGRKLNATYER